MISPLKNGVAEKLTLLLPTRPPTDPTPVTVTFDQTLAITPVLSPTRPPTATPKAPVTDPPAEKALMILPWFEPASVPVVDQPFTTTSVMPTLRMVPVFSATRPSNPL